ncbi:hypothetical protein QYM36_000822 [Artemia franciscana]|uniref:Uncharacterized protein n=1 Tax=Artemia franciscana TaxID=6661 RepID=A0AA88I949_ARTSF|nr:hypothetical protein QYM36_000822 [Artemia franciscana]
MVCNVAFSTLGVQKDYQKPWITDEIIHLCNEKCKVTNKLDRESRDRYKQLKVLYRKQYATFTIPLLKKNLSSVKRLVRNEPLTSCTEELGN